MPSPGALWDAFEVALIELERSRGREPRSSGYAARSQEAVYEAGLGALTASLRAIYQEAQRGNPNAIAFPSRSHSRDASGRLQSGQRQEHERQGVHGGGAREGLKDKYPLGCAFVVQHVETAANAYEELRGYCPTK